MTPINLVIQDFMGHAHSDIDCQNFNSCLIVGVNKNNQRISNGVGKSTIFHAIEYVLYNEYPSKKAEEIIKDGKSKCKVSFTFEINGDIYNVSRERTKSVSNLYLKRKLSDGTFEDLSSKSNSETEAELSKILKINHKSFKNCVLFSQNDLDGLASTSSDKRKDLLKEPLQLSYYNQYYKVAKKKLDNEKLNLERNQAVIETLGKPELDIASHIEMISQISTKTDLLKTQKDDIQNILSADIKSLSDLENFLKSNSASVLEQINDVNLILENNKKEIKLTEIQVNDNNSKLQILIDNLIIKQKSLEDKKTTLSKLQSEPKRDLKAVTSEYEEILNKENNGKSLILNIKSQISKLEKELPDKSKCDICFQDINEDHRHNYNDYRQTKLTELNKNLEIYETKLNKCVDARKKLYQECRDIEIYLNQLKTLISDIDSYKNNISIDSGSISSYKDIVNQNKDKLSQLNIIHDNNSKRKLKLIELSQQDKSKEINNKIISLKAKIDETRMNINSLIKEISFNDTIFGVYEEKLNKRKEDEINLNILLTKSSEIKKQIFLYEKVVKAFGPNGIPTMIINNILDDLQIEGSNILSQLRPSLQFQIVPDDSSDSLDIIFKVHGQERDYRLLSGGQKLYFALALKLGLSTVIQKRIGIKINFLGLDEVDQSLDLDGVDAFSDIIKKLQDKFKIFVITHNEHIKNKFNNFIIVEGDDANGSSARYSATLE